MPEAGKGILLNSSFKKSRGIFPNWRLLATAAWVVQQCDSRANRRKNTGKHGDKEIKKSLLRI